MPTPHPRADAEAERDAWSHVTGGLRRRGCCCVSDAPPRWRAGSGVRTLPTRSPGDGWTQRGAAPPALTRHTRAARRLLCGWSPETGGAGPASQGHRCAEGRGPGADPCERGRGRRQPSWSTWTATQVATPTTGWRCSRSRVTPRPALGCRRASLTLLVQGHPRSSGDATHRQRTGARSRSAARVSGQRPPARPARRAEHRGRRRR